MNPIDQLFQQLRSTGRKAFMPFLTAGDPSLPGTGELLAEVVRQGASLVEIGFPYSDPIADGAVIQASYTRALNRGLKLDQIFAAVQGWGAAHPQTPLAAMVSYSLIHHAGPTAFLKRAQRAGFSGAIVPDLPIDEAKPLAAEAAARDFKLIQLVTPTTPRDRAVRIAQQSTGFLYCVSVTGITGARDQLPPQLLDQLAWLRTQTPLPLCVGFGISKPEQVQVLRDVADGIIVGSALVRRIEQADSRPWPEVVREIGELVRSLTQAL
jgi:tryptophan synthase alpha chain